MTGSDADAATVWVKARDRPAQLLLERRAVLAIDPGRP